MRRHRAIVLAATVAVLAGCGASGSDAVTSEGTGSLPAPSLVVTPIAATTDTCPIEAEILRSLVVAYTAEFGVAPTSEADFDANGIQLDLPSVDLTPEGVIDTGRDVCMIEAAEETVRLLHGACAEEVDRMVVDWFVSTVMGGEGSPLSVAHDLGVDHGPYVLYEPDPQSLAPLTDECPSGAEVAAATSASNTCDVDRVVLETAVATWVAQFGTEPADVQALVDGQLIRTFIDDHVLVLDSSGATEVVPVPGGPCDA